MRDMGKKQLNFSAPLLSTRNNPLTDRRNTFPSKNPDLSLGEVAKPGSVPFMWEQIPGRAKSGSSSQVHSPDDPATTPRLPPGRISGVKSGELGFFKPPNRFSGELNLGRPQKQNKFLSGELGVVRAQNRLPSLRKADDDLSSDADDAAFSDALDALELFSVNCSTSGLSSSEPSVDPSTDVGNRDFMMNRFLPAAKAMTLDSPQYASKRQIVAVEQPLPTKVIVPKIVKGLPRAHERSMAITPYNGQDLGSETSEDEREQGILNEPRNISVRSCGFFPWFCSKSALRLFNPVPAMKVKTKRALASASKVKKLVKNASYKSPSRTSSKVKLRKVGISQGLSLAFLKPGVSLAMISLSLRTSVWSVAIQPSSNPAMSEIYQHKVNPVTKSCELNRVESKPKLKSRPMFYSGELPSRNGEPQSQGRSLSPYRNYRRSTVSPYRSEPPHSPFNNGIGYFIVPKTADHPHNTSNRSGPMSFDSRKTHGSSGRMDIVKARGTSKPSEPHLDQTLLRKPSQSFRSSNRQTNGHGNAISKEIIARSESPLPPPLPKSPTESWLSRNLNAVSPRNSVSQLHSSAKWETIVKSSHLRCDHGRFSEELVGGVHQKSRTRK